MTSQRLVGSGKMPASRGEILKFLGIVILGTRLEFGSRAELWQTRHMINYVPPAYFGRIGMSRKRSDDTRGCLRWRNQLDERPADMSSEWYGWSLVDDFVNRFNEERKRMPSPSELICVDENMSCWYGVGVGALD